MSKSSLSIEMLFRRSFTAERSFVFFSQDFVQELTVVVPGDLVTQFALDSRKVGGGFSHSVNEVAFERLFFPPNLESISGGVSPGDMFSFLIRDWGVPLYLVPSADIARRLIASGSHRDCMDVLVSCEQEILDCCGRLFSEACSSRRVGSFAKMGLDTVKLVRGLDYRSVAPAQALFLNLIESLVGRIAGDWGGLRGREGITVRSKDSARRRFFKPRSCSVVDLVVFVPVLGVYKPFFSRDRGSIDSTVLSRHASVHHADVFGQYSRGNMIQSAMVLASLVGFLHRGGGELLTRGFFEGVDSCLNVSVWRPQLAGGLGTRF